MKYYLIQDVSQVYDMGIEFILRHEKKNPHTVCDHFTKLRIPITMSPTTIAMPDGMSRRRLATVFQS